MKKRKGFYSLDYCYDEICNTKCTKHPSIYIGSVECYFSYCTAKRSFVTNLYKQEVDIYTISKLGHSSVEMTKQYICCGPIIKDSVKDYLNSFSK